MPASRSRTERWQASLQSILERGGGLEFSIARGPEEADAIDLVWRVRLLAIEEKTLVVEHPGALGRKFAVNPATPLLGVIAVGQNRWMFHTTVAETFNDPRGNACIRVEAPTKVERCLRRASNRISTARINPPSVTCWPLLDISSAISAEHASRVTIEDCDRRGVVQNTSGEDAGTDEALPKVGPSFEAELANVGGGGIGLKINQDHTSGVGSTPVYWLRFDFTPEIPAPFGLTARLVHTRVDSSQALYAGMAFEFGMNPGHKDFVLKMFNRYVVASQQRLRAA